MSLLANFLGDYLVFLLCVRFLTHNYPIIQLEVIGDCHTVILNARNLILVIIIMCFMCLINASDTICQSICQLHKNLHPHLEMNGRVYRPIQDKMFRNLPNAYFIELFMLIFPLFCLWGCNVWPLALF